MPTREYEIKLSAAFTKSPAVVLNDLPAASEKAKAKVEGDAKKMGDAVGKAFDGAVGRAKKAYADIEAASAKTAAKEAADATKKSQAKVKADMAAFDAKLKLLDREVAAEQKVFDQKVRAQARYLAQQRKAKEREAENAIKDAEREAAATERIQARTNDKRANANARLATNIASGAFNNIGRMASGAMGLGRQIAQGVGIDFSLSGQLSKNVAFQKNITDVTNAGLGIQGKLAGKEDYASTTKAVDSSADYLKMDRGVVAESLAAFVDKASDIEAGKKLLSGLGDVALASGTDLVTLSNSAGEVWKMMGEGPDKIKNVLDLLAVGAKGGQVGNLAFKELAGSIGRLASQAGSFRGNFKDNFTDLMAIAQISAKGGSVGGAQMNRSAQAFAQDITKKRSIKEFKSQGVNIFADQKEDGSGTKIRPTEDIIVDVLRLTKGDKGQLSKLFPGQKSNAVITGALNVANEHGGGDAGIQAVRDEFTKYRGAMSQEEIKNSSDARKNDTDSKAAAFNNQLERIAASLAERVLPQMEKLGPEILHTVESLSKVIGWAAENPGSAITAAIIASIGKAAIGNSISAALPEIMKTAMSGAGAASMTGVGKLGTAGLAISVGVASFMITKAFIDMMSSETSAGQNSSVNGDAEVSNALTSAKAALKGPGGGDAAEALKEAEKQKAALDERIANAQDTKPDASGIGINAIFDAVIGRKSLEKSTEGKEDAAKLEKLKSDDAALARAITGLHEKLGSVINVNVVGGGAVAVGAGGREGVH
jgi:hypothetical protein